MGHFRVGILGWRYAGWRGDFYPKGLPHKRELEYASRQFNTIEINGTFYSLQRPESFRNWYDTAPGGFRFAVKGSRFITHMKKLKDVKPALANFFASGVLALKELGPVLWQFPPQLAYNQERFESFLELLPRTTTAAAALATKHDRRVSGRAYLRADRPRRIRHALEVLHDSFMVPEFLALLPRHEVPLSLQIPPDTGRMPKRSRPTLSMCGCTAQPSCTAAATAMRSLLRGRARSGAGGAPPSSISTMTGKSGRRSMRGGSPSASAWFRQRADREPPHE